MADDNTSNYGVRADEAGAAPETLRTGAGTDSPSNAQPNSDFAERARDAGLRVALAPIHDVKAAADALRKIPGSAADLFAGRGGDSTNTLTNTNTLFNQLGTLTTGVEAILTGGQSSFKRAGQKSIGEEVKYQIAGAPSTALSNAAPLPLPAADTQPDKSEQNEVSEVSLSPKNDFANRAWRYGKNVGFALVDTAKAGARGLAELPGDTVDLFNNNGKPLKEKFAELATDVTDVAEAAVMGASGGQTTVAVTGTQQILKELRFQAGKIFGGKQTTHEVDPAEVADNTGAVGTVSSSAFDDPPPRGYIPPLTQRETPISYPPDVAAAAKAAAGGLLQPINLKQEDQVTPKTPAVITGKTPTTDLGIRTT